MRLSDLIGKKFGKKESPPKEQFPEEKKISVQPEKLYGQLIKEARNLAESVRQGKPRLGENLPELFEQLKSQILSGSPDLLEFADKSTPNNYLSGHIVNVTILVLRLGFSLKKTEEELGQLAWAAFTHDLGMIDLLPTVLQPKKLTAQEKARLKFHPQQSVELLQRLTAVPKELKAVINPIVFQVHERWQGQGYPQGLKENEINPLARLLALADTYEALTHPRSWRNRYLPYAAVKMTIKIGSREFDPALLKGLIGSLTLFPVGSFLRLSNGEIAKVIKVFSDSPTRPMVKIILNKENQHLKEQKIIDLSQNYMLNIEETLDETELRIPDGEFALGLRLNRWWTEDGE